MDLTELLITGYDADKPVIAVNLSPGNAAVVLTGQEEDGGDPVVDSTWRQNSQAFASVCRLIQDLAESRSLVA
jgi:hypothetical protein